MGFRRPGERCPYPSAVWWVVLATVFLTEHAVMGVLPWLLPGPHSRFAEATVDSLILPAVLAPVVWWTVVRPLREVIRLRARFVTGGTRRTRRTNGRSAPTGRWLRAPIDPVRAVLPCGRSAGIAGAGSGFRLTGVRTPDSIRCFTPV